MTIQVILQNTSDSLESMLDYANQIYDKLVKEFGEDYNPWFKDYKKDIIIAEKSLSDFKKIIGYENPC